jgi:OOP family OmpA-OmpF porin
MVEAEDYIAESAPIVVAKDETKIQNFVLKPIPKVGERVVLRGITFDFNSAVIKPSSYPVLDDAARVFKAKPTIRVEISGHTDSIGSDSYNMKLSNQRANSVRDYLIRYHNIDPSRLIAVGYGETQPIADNRTRSGRDMNRRIEFKVLSW